MRPPHVHNLRGNKAERSPHRLFVWDTETHQDGDDRHQLHRLRLWCATIVQRHGRRPRQPREVTAQGAGPEDLVSFLEGACRSGETVWAFAHNQGFDLAVTRLPLRLQARGWSITAHALTTASPWARLSRGNHRLVLADSTSWLPVPLAALGQAVGIPKPPLPEQDGEPEDWRARCRHDVDILSRALQELMDWWDRRHLGSWSITGPQSGFNLMRHVPTPHTVVIDPDPAARAFERLALVAGRREVWRTGRLEWGDYREIDFERAHATVAAHCPLPKRRSKRFETMDLEDWRLSSERWAPIAWATVRAQTPRYPVQLGGRLFYPLGTFRTVLCGPELLEARRRGELLEVGPGYLYQLGAHMARWGRWVLSELASPNPDTPEVARTAIKAWSRQVPGKWAARTGRTTHQGVSAEQGWSLEHGRHHPSGAPVTVLDMAGRREIVLQDQDADDCFPAVLAWIQAEVRVRLGRLIDAIGVQNMIACNTDGVLCTGAGAERAAAQGGELAPLRAREKARHAWLDIISPQHVITPSERRLSGVPGSAQEVGPHQYQWMTWPRLPSQIADGDPQGYVRSRRTADLSGVPVNRWRWPDGTCTPVVTELGEDGTTRVRLDGLSWAAGQRGELAPRQHPVLAALLEEPAQ